jgi:hypothetical protein
MPTSALIRRDVKEVRSMPTSSNARLVICAAACTWLLVACGGGSGAGLDENGQPLGPGGASGGTGLAPTLSSIQANVFSVSCAVAGCHGGSSAQFGLRLDPGFSAGNLINVPSPRAPNLIRVVPGNPDASFLIQKLEGTQSLGERMPLFGPYLPQSTIDVIREWIRNGAPA